MKYRSRRVTKPTGVESSPVQTPDFADRRAAGDSPASAPSGSAECPRRLERRLGFPIDVDDVPQFLKRPKDEERIDEERKELADGDRARIYKVEHQREDARAKGVYAGALDEAETPQVTHLLQLELQNLRRRGVEPLNLLLAESEALDQLDLRSDSVVEPASAVVSATMTFWICLMRRLSTELSRPRSGTVRKYTGAITQCTLSA